MLLNARTLYVSPCVKEYRYDLAAMFARTLSQSFIGQPATYCVDGENLKLKWKEKFASMEFSLVSDAVYVQILTVRTLKLHFKGKDLQILVKYSYSDLKVNLRITLKTQLYVA